MRVGRRTLRVWVQQRSRTLKDTNMNLALGDRSAEMECRVERCAGEDIPTMELKTEGKGD